MPIRGHPFSWQIKKPRYGSRGLAVKNHCVAALGEFVGTTLFLLFALGCANIAHLPSTSVTGITAAGQAGSTAQTLNTSNLLYIAFGFGISLTVTAWVFFRVSGGLFNPAITLGMLLVGALSPLRAAILAFVQLLGGIVGTAILDALTPGTLNVRTTLAPGMSISRGLFLEAAMTALLMLAILLLAAEKSRVTFQAPLPIGLALFIGQLASVYWTGGSLKYTGTALKKDVAFKLIHESQPARTFGPDVVLHTFENYTWIYFLGPALGATAAALFYRLIKFLEYETVLAGDVDGAEVPPHSKERDSRMETGAEPVEPKGGGVPVEATGFGQGMLRFQDAYLENRAGPLADPSDLFKKMDHLEGMMTSILVHLEGENGIVELGRRLSGDTVTYRPTLKTMTEKAELARST